jgi:uncharacterized membrane protein YkvA (DUF1232 family)
MAADNKEMKEWIRKGLGVGVALLTKKESIGEVLGSIYDKNKRNVRVNEFLNGFKSLGRMAKAYFKGDYRDVSPWLFINTAAGLAYLISDIDLISDKIPGLGLLDDAGVVIWVVDIYLKEIEKFNLWEASNRAIDIELA